MEPLANAEELREAVKFHKAKKEEKTKEELLEEWIEKFDKNVDRALKEAVREGVYACSLRLPFQPNIKNIVEWNQTTKIKGVSLRSWVKQKLPGCEVEYVEEAMPNVKGGYFTFEISWSV